MRTAPAPNVMAETQREFQRLSDEWKSSRGPATTVTAMVRHPAYQAIVQLGEPAIPLLMRELEQQPDHWFAALRAITGANPVHEDELGDVTRMAESWIEWGRANGYRWS